MKRKRTEHEKRLFVANVAWASAFIVSFAFMMTDTKVVWINITIYTFIVTVSSALSFYLLMKEENGGKIFTRCLLMGTIYTVVMPVIKVYSVGGGDIETYGLLIILCIAISFFVVVGTTVCFMIFSKNIQT